MHKKVSKFKVFLCALLGYIVLNGIRTILFELLFFAVYSIGINSVPYVLKIIVFAGTTYFGFYLAEKLGNGILKSREAVDRYFGTIGILLLVNYTYFFVDYLRYREGDFDFIFGSLIVGICLLLESRKKK